MTPHHIKRHIGINCKGADELKRAKIDVKTSIFYNSSYICLCDATLMACELWKIVLIE